MFARGRRLLRMMRTVNERSANSRKFNPRVQKTCGLAGTLSGKGRRKRGNSSSTEELWAGEGGRGGSAGSGRHIAGTAAGEGCRASISVHAHANTCMAACWVPHQRPSAGTGSPGRTALPSMRACSGIEAMICPRVYCTIIMI